MSTRSRTLRSKIGKCSFLTKKSCWRTAKCHWEADASGTEGKNVCPGQENSAEKGENVGKKGGDVGKKGGNVGKKGGNVG